MKWLDGKTAPQTGVRFLAAWRVSDAYPGSMVDISRPGSIINVSGKPGDFRILQRVWWDGQHVYGDPHYWMPLGGE
jgi:hypothetical protein